MAPLPFPVPAVVDNVDGWGPCSVPEHLKDVPFQPFSKGDKIGRAGDWNQSAYANKFGGKGTAAAAGARREDLRQAGAAAASPLVCMPLLPICACAGRYAQSGNPVFSFFQHEEVRPAAAAAAGCVRG